jgi:hypothetical protein
LPNNLKMQLKVAVIKTELNTVNRQMHSFPLMTPTWESIKGYD